MTSSGPLNLPLQPGAMIGILGGGQLGLMLTEAANALGYKTYVYSDALDSPAFRLAAKHKRASYDDQAALAEFAKECDIVTFEFENVPDAALDYLASHVAVAPSPRVLRISQDRLLEKEFVAALAIAPAKFCNVESVADAKAAFAALGAPAILKTRKFGYDGKGQKKVMSAGETEAAYLAFGAPSILEGFVDFSFECSVIAARGRDGAFAAYDPPENVHENHILRRSIVPARLSAPQTAEAKLIAKRIADAFEYVGVMAVELFVTRNGGFIVNEIAPRVHNSGHWTIEACKTSQFEQHIRAICGLPLGDPSRHADAVMENIIGFEIESFKTPEPGLHLYGKAEAKPGRKMGHITRLK